MTGERKPFQRMEVWSPRRSISPRRAYFQGTEVAVMIRRVTIVTSLATLASFALLSGPGVASTTINAAPATRGVPLEVAKGGPPGYLVGEVRTSSGPGLDGVAGDCATHVALGGGVLIKATSLNPDINGAFPFSAPGPLNYNWQTDVNNTTDSIFPAESYTICAKVPPDYTEATTSFQLAPDSQTGQGVLCPGSLVVWGGGVSAVGNLLVSINFTGPVGRGWSVDMNNASTSEVTEIVYALCAKKPAGYSIVYGHSVENPSRTLKEATARCPGASVPLSGGGFSSSDSTAVALNSTFPDGHSWKSIESNNSGARSNFAAAAVCAGT
jgi:hypothetical protein